MIGAAALPAWRQARAQSLLKEGRCVLIWQYLAAVNRHLLEWRAGNESRLYAGGNLKQVMAFVRKAAPERIICNELVGWDRIEAVLTFLRALQSAGSRLEVPIHDYFAVCPTIVLLDRDNAYCGVPDIRRCSTCLPGHPLKPRGTPDDIAPWRQAWGTFLASADEVLVPDQSVPGDSGESLSDSACADSACAARTAGRLEAAPPPLSLGSVGHRVDRNHQPGQRSGIGL